MKPSERIEQITQPLLEVMLKAAREHIENTSGEPISDGMWADYLPKLEASEAYKQLALNTKVVAIIAYLDEQAEPKKKNEPI